MNTVFECLLELTGRGHCLSWSSCNCAFCFCLLVENIPAELRDPFYCDQYDQEHLKPPVARLLQSSDLYCRTYSLLLGGMGGEAQPKDNAALLQLVAERGLVSKDRDSPVTDADLGHKPIKMVKVYLSTTTNRLRPLTGRKPESS